MLSGSWKNTHVFCGNPNHTEKHEMTLQLRHNSPVYACNHCKNVMSTYLFEKMISKCSKIIVDAMMNNEYILLTNVRWKTKTQRYRVLLHEDERIDIEFFDDVYIEKED